MRIHTALSLTFFLGAVGATPAMAQRPSNNAAVLTSSAAVDAALADHESAVDRQRAQLAELLSRPEIQNLARDRGVDMGRVASSAAGLSDAEVRGVAPLVAEATAALQNGGLGTVTISVAAVIIILLILILVT
jgi:hypothetical protein